MKRLPAPRWHLTAAGHLCGPSCTGFVGKGAGQGGGGKCVVAGATSPSIPRSVPFDTAKVSAVKTLMGEGPTEEVPPGRAAKRSGPTDQ